MRSGLGPKLVQYLWRAGTGRRSRIVDCLAAVPKWKAERRAEVFNWHALRHFAISCWIDVGLPPETAQTFASHNVEFTIDRHSHLFRSDRQAEAVDAIAAEIYEPSGTCGSSVRTRLSGLPVESDA